VRDDEGTTASVIAYKLFEFPFYETQYFFQGILTEREGSVQLISSLR
jgi:hypothetical protein